VSMSKCRTARERLRVGFCASIDPLKRRPAARRIT
jgi:hypothetical protein